MLSEDELLNFLKNIFLIELSKIDKNNDYFIYGGSKNEIDKLKKYS